MTVPNFMPILSHGMHNAPEDGACLMEYISVLAGDAFSDHPWCVHPLLRNVGMAVNDNLSDGNRHLLIPLIPRLMNTAMSSGEEDDDVIHKLDDSAEKQGYANVFEFLSTPLSAAQWGKNEGEQSRETAEKLVRAFESVLDAYDRIVGRPQGHEVTVADGDKRLAGVAA